MQAKQGSTYDAAEFNMALKKVVDNGSVTKIKASYKLSNMAMKGKSAAEKKPATKKPAPKKTLTKVAWADEAEADADADANHAVQDEAGEQKNSQKKTVAKTVPKKKPAKKKRVSERDV